MKATDRFYEEISWDLSVEQPYPGALGVRVSAENGQMEASLDRKKVKALRDALVRWLEFDAKSAEASQDWLTNPVRDLADFLDEE